MHNVEIDDFHLRDIKNEIHPSIFIKTQEYDLLIVRLPFKEGENELELISNAFIFTHDSYYFYDRNKQEFTDLKDTKGLYTLLNEKVNCAMSVSNDIYDKIEDIEDSFYENENVKNFNHLWFLYKNSLIKINRTLVKTIEQMKRFVQNYKREDDFLEINFSDILEHLERSHRSSSHSLEKLDALYNFYVSNSNERINKTMYVLTLLSGVFLPLNLVVGFFGMNTTSLPFTQGVGGTYFVGMILLGLGIFAYAVTLFLKKTGKIYRE
ncbi:MAG: CorA family divalent cation transporter [Candidatus Marinarcus sp.]|uniref:CorA family divalent cation transporter n=1 Tax=Candidatus Marinarcus sp. TaxID=3100987 RepID=UPI003B00DDCF